MMTRIELLETLKSVDGMNEPLAEAIVNNVEAYLDNHKKRLEESFNKRLVQAKSVVLAETNRWKADQAKRIGIFLESKVRNVETQVRRQTGLNESQAIAELARLKQTLVGTPVENKTLQAKIDQLSEEVTKLKAKEVNLKEEYQKLYTVSKNAVKHSTKIERELNETKTKLTESQKLISEGRNRTGGGAGSNKAPALAGSVLNENNERKPKAPPAKPAKAAVNSDVAAVLSTMD